MSPQEFTQPTVAEMVTGVAAYYRQEREVYVRHSEPLEAGLRAKIQPYFSKELLDRLKTITLTGGARIPPPHFYAKAKEMSGGKFPDFVHMASITYIDVIVFHDEIDPRALFHGAVHAAQMSVLGFERYVELYVRGFVKHLSWLAIPLEAQAFQLEARFAENRTDVFSVEDEIRASAADGRYE
jgi:hypothetical protein